MNPTKIDDELLRHGIPEKTILIIFGASGDLTRRKLMPALYHLSRENLLPEKFKFIGIGRRIDVGEEFQLNMKHRVIQYCSHKMENRFWNPLKKNMESIKANYQDPKTFIAIHKRINEISNLWKTEPNLLIYLATNPSHFEIIAKNLAEANLITENETHWTRLIVEKPFGLDYNSSLKLNNTLIQFFKEEQIYRIDHFLGKEAIQNILLFRIYNSIFQPLWNKEYIDHVQITSAETIGVEGRVGFFEQTGAIRDMIQSHLLQIMAFLTMELPSSLKPEDIRKNKLKLLNDIRIYNNDGDIEKNCIRGQYDQGVVNSELVKKYRDEDGVPKDSMVETYAALKLFIDNQRWTGVPFYLRTGKRMPRRKTEIFIQLKSSNTTSKFNINQQPNSIRLEIQPQAGVDININWKPPGILSEIEPTMIGIAGEAHLKEPKAYERLLVDAMRGDATLFIHIDEILTMWKIVDPIINYWKRHNNNKDIFPNYFAGTKGPSFAKEFIRKDGRRWSKI